MSKRLEIEKYGLHCYDDFLCLRPPRLLIACLIFLCRSLIFLVLWGMTGGAPPTFGGIVSLETLWTDCLAAVPALLVLYALVARVPSAGAVVRWIWSHGLGMVSLTALLNIGFATAQLGSPRTWLSDNMLALKAVVLLELAILAYVLLSPRVRQAFRDFPSE